MGVRDSAYWDRWWRERLGDDDAKVFADFLPGPLLKYGNRIFDLNSDDLLVSMMAEYGLKSVLCAGNGISPGPWTLAAQGADVTVLDISAVATTFAEAIHIPSGGRGLVDSPQWLGPGGRVQFVVGDLLDVTVCEPLASGDQTREEVVSSSR